MTRDEGDATAVARTDPPEADEAVRRTLGLDGNKRRRWWRWLLGAAVVFAIGGVGVAASGGDDDGPRYEMGAVERGDLAITVSATGRLEARETVDVGAEVSGRILDIHVDFNDRVEKGQLLAEIATDKLDARVRELGAQLRLERAEVRRAKVDAKHAVVQRDRARVLAGKGLAADRELEAAEAAAARAAALVDSARARATMAGAALAAANEDVTRARIVAPIDGIVLSRNVERGQTLASAFQVPVLFTIARDLTEMELRVAVDEADVGRVRAGQTARFEVEAYGGRSFDSRVVSLRNVPTLDQGVVSYEAVLAVDNRERLLRPGMTATASIITDELSDVLLVPNAALRFLPPDEAAEVIEKSGEPNEKRETGPRVWTLDQGKPIAHAVEVGRSDGEHTQLVGGDLAPGAELLVDIEKVDP